MFLQNSLTGAQSEAVFRIDMGQGIIVIRLSNCLGSNLKNTEFPGLPGTDNQNSSIPFAQNMQTVPKQLPKDLQQLVGITDNFGRSSIEFGPDLDVLCLPLRFRQLHRGTSQRIKVEWSLGRGRLTGKADQAGYQ